MAVEETAVVLVGCGLILALLGRVYARGAKQPLRSKKEEEGEYRRRLECLSLWARVSMVEAKKAMKRRCSVHGAEEWGRGKKYRRTLIGVMPSWS